MYKLNRTEKSQNTYFNRIDSF